MPPAAAASASGVVLQLVGPRRGGEPRLRPSRLLPACRAAGPEGHCLPLEEGAGPVEHATAP
eukprot:1598507-Alexandrium_andersonii.AAC.1